MQRRPRPKTRQEREFERQNGKMGLRWSRTLLCAGHCRAFIGLDKGVSHRMACFDSYLLLQHLNQHKSMTFSNINRRVSSIFYVQQPSPKASCSATFASISISLLSRSAWRLGLKCPPPRLLHCAKNGGITSSKGTKHLCCWM